jgi:predicted phage terminase large subunit-like protein
VLESIRRALGSYDFSAQYQQEPLPLDGDLIKWAWFRHYDMPPARGSGDLVVQSWDTASKAEEIHDWSVGTTWLRRGQEHYLLEVVRVRLDYPALKRRIVAEAERWRPDAVLIEDKGSGTSLLQDLRADGRVHPLAVQAEADKVTRMYAQTAKLEAGQVLLPHGPLARRLADRAAAVPARAPRRSGRQHGAVPGLAGQSPVPAGGLHRCAEPGRAGVASGVRAGG